MSASSTGLTLEQQSALDKVFRAKSVAIIGASANPKTPRGLLMQILKRTGYQGKIFPVNPSTTEIEGIPCYPNVAAVPEVPDVALIIITAADVPQALRECGKSGVRAAVVFSSGFEEAEGGEKLAAELASAAQESNVAVIGPNCQGVWSVAANVMLTFGGAASYLTKLTHAPISILSQSGAMGGAIANYFQANGIGCAYMVSTGNETALTAIDLLAWMVEQNDVKVVLLYIEGLREGARLLPIAQRARERGIKIVALKTGNSALGQQATASHTGKIASPYAIYRDIFEQAGILQAGTLADMFDAAEALLFMPNLKPAASGAGVSVLSTSGGACALLADHSEHNNVPMAKFSTDTKAKLKTILPAFASQENPIDLTGQIRSNPKLMDDSIDVIAKEKATEALILQFASSGRRDVDEKGDVFKAAARSTKLPMIMSFGGTLPLSAEERKTFLEAGIMASREPSQTIRYLSWLYRSREANTRQYHPSSPIGPSPAVPHAWDEMVSYLAEATISVPAGRVVKSTDDIESMVAKLRKPWVVKALPEQADHKTELGLVALGVRDAADAARHAAWMRTQLRSPDAGILVQEMVHGGIEVVLSVLRNKDFGDVLAIGMGGTAVELFRDVAYLALPIDEELVVRALRKLKLWTLLSGFRGKPEADIGALAKAAVALSRRFAATPECREIEINPLFVMPKGQGVIAIDALFKGGEG